MSEIWAERQRRTNQLVRIAAEYIFNQGTVVEPEQLYGLCKLTWITEGADDALIKSTKIPALEAIFQENFSGKTIEEVGKEIAKILNEPKVGKLIITPTGFVNYYNAYRNSSLAWIIENHEILPSLFKEAFKLSSDEQGLELIKKITKLPGIPKPNNDALGHPENLITPMFFALDPRIRFPIINGNKWVKNLLSALKVTDGSLEAQYKAMVNLYGTGSIHDAADLDQASKDFDQAGKDIIDFFEIAGKKPTKKFLGSQPTTGTTELPSKDETDLISLQEARTVKSKRLHNVLTNKLRNSLLPTYQLQEGCGNGPLFDVMVKNYDENKNDLLIEVKSSSETPHIRMAIGQLYDYWFKLKGKTDPHHLAILLPNPPDKEIKNLLEFLDIGILWFSGDKLKTYSKWLDKLVES